jgi:hypothetical protein
VRLTWSSVSYASYHCMPLVDTVLRKMTWVRALVVAAGGGGDAITGAVLAGPLRLTEPPAVMTYSWDRLMVDPLPGPRTAADFEGLAEREPHVIEVLPTTRPTPPAGSSLPRLAAELPARLFLLDPAHGAVGITRQIAATARHLRADTIALVDVGGDVLATGRDPGLRSPLADQLALAGCVLSGIPTRLLVTGAGLDGELPEPVVLQRLRQLDAERLPDLTAGDIEPVRDVFTWHPSEASGLLAAAAAGCRGRVEVRDAGDQVDLTGSTVAVYAVDAAKALSVTPGGRLRNTRTLDEVEQAVRDATGISEIEYETRKAERRANESAHLPRATDLAQVDRYAAEARERGADFITARRLSELLGATTLDGFAALAALLAHERPDAYLPPIYRTAPATVPTDSAPGAGR